RENDESRSVGRRRNREEIPITTGDLPNSDFINSIDPYRTREGSMTRSTFKETNNRAALVTNGNPAKHSPGLLTYEHNGIGQLKVKLREYSKPSYSSEEIFGQYCHTAEYIACPVEMAFEYAANVYCLEEFTFSLRNFHYVGGGLYKGSEALAKDTVIYMRVDA